MERRMTARHDADAQSLSFIVEQMTSAGDEEAKQVTVADILGVIGQRSFGAMLLVPGLIVLSPISGIPGVPTMGALAVVLIVGQMLIGKRCFWVPEVLRRRRISRVRMVQARRFLLPMARFVDRLVWPRLSFLTRGPFAYLIALTCLAIALIMPPLEAILFANVVTSAAISAFGLALVAHDGVLAAIAFALTGGSFWFAISQFLL